MKDIESNIIKLISNYYTGSLTESDSLTLMSWINEHPDNKDAFKQYISLLHDYKKIRFIEQHDSKRTFHDLSGGLNKKARIRLIRNFSIAASFLILISLGIAIRFNTKSKDHSMEQARIDQLGETGSRKASLTFANGNTVNLDAIENQTFQEEDGTLIEKDNSNTLSYKSDSKATDSNLFNTVEVPRGGEYSLVLSDGSKVWLNAESSIRFPVSFNSAERAVFLTGEAFFDVKSDIDRPFVVHLLNAKVKVLGTRFNLNGYPERDYISATLVDGELEVYTKTQKEKIYPGTQALLYKADDNIEVNKVNTNLYTSWVDGILEFENRDLEFIMIQLSRWYQVDFKFNDNDLKNTRFSGAIKRNNSFEYALDLIERISDVKFTVEDSIIVIEKKK